MCIRDSSSPLLETSIDGAHGVLVNVTGSMDIGLEEVEVAAGLVQSAACLLYTSRCV